MDKKILVIYYSRNGHTKKICEEVAKSIKADIDEIIDLKDRKRKIIGWCIAGKDALMKKDTKIKFSKDHSKYNLIIIGTPNWVGTMTPSIRTYLKQNKTKLKNKKLAFICTFGGNTGHVFEDMQQLSKKPIAVLALKDKHIEKNLEEVKKNLHKFYKSLKH